MPQFTAVPCTKPDPSVLWAEKKMLFFLTGKPNPLNQQELAGITDHHVTAASQDV